MSLRVKWSFFPPSWKSHHIHNQFIGIECNFHIWAYVQVLSVGRASLSRACERASSFTNKLGYIFNLSSTFFFLLITWTRGLKIIWVKSHVGLKTHNVCQVKIYHIQKWKRSNYYCGNKNISLSWIKLLTTVPYNMHSWA